MDDSILKIYTCMHSLYILKKEGMFSLFFPHILAYETIRKRIIRLGDGRRRKRQILFLSTNENKEKQIFI